MKLSKFKKNNFKKITKLSLLATVMVLLTWSTPNFCPLTFGQGSSLKALDRTPENLARTIAAVESAVGDKDPGVKVLIKHYGSGATKAALLETLRKMQVVMPAGGTAAAASKRLTEGVRAAAAAETAVIAAVAAAEVAEARVVVDKRAVLAASAAASSGAGRTAGPLTFGQGSSLKALDVSQVSNLDKVIAAVAAATGDRDPGIKVLAKHYGSASTKAALLAKLQEKRAEMPAAAPAPTAVASAGAPTAVAGAGAGGEAVSVSEAAPATESAASASWRVPAIIKNWWSSSSEPIAAGPTAAAGAGAAESKQVQSWGAYLKDRLAGISVRHRELIDKKRTSTLSDDEIAELKELEEARSAKINAIAMRL